MIDLRRLLAERAAQGIGTGGGLFGATDQQGQPMGLLGGMTNINPNLLIGASIAGAGLQGKDPFSSILPATLQAAQISKYLTPKGTKYKQLTQQEKIDKGLDPSKQWQMDIKTEKISQIGGSGTNVNVNTTDPAAVPLKIRKQYLEESKNFIQRKESRNAILSNTQIDFDKRTPADDFTLVYKYYKFVDPGSVVKESEFENLEKIGSAGDKIKRIIPKFTKGTTLTKSQVQNLEKAMEREFPSYVKDQTKRENTYSRIFKEGNYDTDVYLQSFIDLSNDKESLPVSKNMRGMGTKNLSLMSDEELLEYARKKGTIR